jgi:hemerythrin-like domain-containing protein
MKDMTAIIDSLRSDHSRLTKLLDALERQIAAFEEGGQPDFEIMDGILHYCRSYPDRHHHPCEDLVYEALQRRNSPAAAAVGDLPREHSKLVALTSDFAEQLTAVEQDIPMQRQALTAAARAFLDAYRRHIRTEEKLFFPTAERWLRPEDWRQIRQRLPAAADPLFERREDQRFAALAADILAWDSQLPAGA